MATLCEQKKLYDQLPYLRLWLQWIRQYGFLVAHNKLNEYIGSERSRDVQLYAYRHGFTYHHNGKLIVNPSLDINNIICYNEN